MLRHWPTLRYRRMLGCADVGLAGRDRRAPAWPVIAEPHETLVRPVIAERQQTVVFVQLIRVDQASSPVGFYSGHDRRQRRLLIPVIPRTGRARAYGRVRACFRRGPREGAQLGLGVRQRLMLQVPGAGTAPRPRPGLRSALSRVPGLALTGVPGLGLRLWPRGPRAGRAATQRCARTLALPSRPVLSHDLVYPSDDSLNAFT
jgi:hypothetical protein